MELTIKKLLNRIIKGFAIIGWCLKNMKRKNTLDELCVGECGRVGALLCSGSIRRRLLDVGLAPGTEVTCIGRSPFGDPSAYLVRGCQIAIRKSDAHGIALK